MKISFRRPWWQAIFRARSRRPLVRPRTVLWLEQLEARALPSATPQLVADINPGSAPSNPSHLVVIGSTTFFTADDGAHGSELWKTDGTSAGTALVKDINPGSASASLSNLTNVNGTLFLSADDGAHGTELWKLPPASVAAASLAVSGFPASTTAGSAGTFTVTAKNVDGTTAIGYTGTVHFTNSDGQAALPRDYTYTAADAGVHTFTATLKTAGTQSLMAAENATASLSASQTGIVVNPAAASTLTVADFPSPSEDTGEYRLAPAYDLLNTRLHVPNESRPALPLFKGGSTTPSYEANGFYAYDDFVAFAQKLGLVETRYGRALQGFVDHKDAVYSLIDRSILPDECKQLYKDHVQDRVNALSYSYADWRGRKT